jgi:hypothetical protein
MIPDRHQAPVEDICCKATLHNFRRIHAAKRGFRGWIALASVRNCKLIQWLDGHSVAPRQIVACCTYAAANPQQNLST